MTYLRHIQAAVFAGATDNRSIGEVLARACKRVGDSDPAGVRFALGSLVSSTIGRDGRNAPVRRRRARLRREELR